jgi:hypothetical protein
MGPEGSILTLQYTNQAISNFKIWKEKVASGSARILNASGLISNGWQKKLNPSGLGFQAADFTDSRQIYGRVCPTNVFIDYSNMAQTNRCLYRSDASGVRLTSSGGTEAVDWLHSWGSTRSGKGAAASYYEGNIKTCSGKNMRLPVIYETAAYETEGCTTCFGSGSAYPTGDSITPPQGPGAPTSNGKTFLGFSGTWTATASANPVKRNNYLMFNGSEIASYNSSGGGWIICVLPSH